MSALLIQACSDKGISRQKNEDMISVSGILIRDSSLTQLQEMDEEGVYYYLVADGMGGHEKGEFASEYTLKHIGRAINTLTDFERDFNALTHWISRDLNRIASEEGQTRLMGNTLSGIVWYKGKVWVINVGDSRTYRLRSGLLKQLTEDQDLNHKYGTDIGQQGLALYNAIGGNCTGEVVMIDFTGRILEGDTLLICSDGLPDMVNDVEIENVLSNDSDNYAQDLINMANKNGGKDNISVIVIKVLNEEDMLMKTAMSVNDEGESNYTSSVLSKLKRVSSFFVKALKMVNN